MPGSRAPAWEITNIDCPGAFACKVNTTTEPLPETPPEAGGRVAVICNVPAGEYGLRAWNDLGAETRQTITLGTSGGAPIAEAKLELRETLRVVSHTNKFGKSYPEKY